MNEKDPPSTAELMTRIQGLQARLKALQEEVRVLQGQVSNRDAGRLKAIALENETLQKRVAALEEGLFSLLVDAFKPRHTRDEKLQYEILRSHTVEYCEKSNVDPEIWKSLVS